MSVIALEQNKCFITPSYHLEGVGLVSKIIHLITSPSLLQISEPIGKKEKPLSDSARVIFMGSLITLLLLHN